MQFVVCWTVNRHCFADVMTTREAVGKFYFEATWTRIKRVYGLKAVRMLAAVLLSNE